MMSFTYHSNLNTKQMYLPPYMVRILCWPLIDERDWSLVQDIIFAGEKNAKSWLELLTKSLDPKNEEFIQIERFIQDYLERFSS